ncbi:MAG: alpha/beta hydrolase [Planctomycetota bacterium]|nr:MAG: alpha/beta hydrolase [Planctomycetota bacterium]
MADIPLLIDGPKKAPWTCLLVPPSGYNMRIEFMAHFAKMLGEAGLRVVRFDYPHMVERNHTGKRRPPDKEPVLCDYVMQVIRQIGAEKLFIGGKSTGARVAAQVADNAGVQAVACLGFPFHATSKPGEYESAPLDRIVTPTILIQGELDTFGDKEEVSGYSLSPNLQIKWIREGDHSLQPPKESKRTREENWNAAAKLVARFFMEVAGVELG